MRTYLIFRENLVTFHFFIIFGKQKKKNPHGVNSHRTRKLVSSLKIRLSTCLYQANGYCFSRALIGYSNKQ